MATAVRVGSSGIDWHGFNPGSLEEVLRSIGAAMDDAVDEYARCVETEEAYELTYDRQFYRALMASDGSSRELREAEARLDCESARSDMVMAKAGTAAAKERCNMLRAQASLLQTLAADRRAVT